MNLTDFSDIFSSHPQVHALMEWVFSNEQNVKVSGLNGSALPLVEATLFKSIENVSDIPLLLIMEDADEAAYVYHDIKNVLGENQAYYFPSSYKKAIKLSQSKDFMAPYRNLGLLTMFSKYCSKEA